MALEETSRVSVSVTGEYDQVKFTVVKGRNGDGTNLEKGNCFFEFILGSQKREITLGNVEGFHLRSRWTILTILAWKRLELSDDRDGDKAFLGSLKLQLSDLFKTRNDHSIKKWFALRGTSNATSATPEGNKLLIEARYLVSEDFKLALTLKQEQTIEKYIGLVTLLAEENLEVAAAMCTINIDPREIETLAPAFVNVFEKHGWSLELLSRCLAVEVDRANDAGSLMRGNSLGVKMAAAFMNTVGSEYLRKVLGPHVLEICAASRHLEIDPSRIDAETAKVNFECVEYVCLKFITTIISSVADCPMPIRLFLQILKSEIQRRFADSAVVLVGGFFFLRFVNPAIISPHVLGWIPEPPSPEARRTLILVSKVLQTLSNHIDLTLKEPYMSVFSPLIQANQQPLSDFLVEVSSPPSIDHTPQPAAEAVEIPASVLCDSLTRIHTHCLRKFTRLSADMAPFTTERLRDVLATLGPPYDSERRANHAAKILQRAMRKYLDFSDVVDVALTEDAPSYTFFSVGQRISLTTRSGNFLAADNNGKLIIVPHVRESAIFTIEAVSGSQLSLRSAVGLRICLNGRVSPEGLRPPLAFDYFEGRFALRVLQPGSKQLPTYVAAIERGGPVAVVPAQIANLAEMDLKDADKLGVLFSVIADMARLPWTNLPQMSRIALRSCHGTFISMEGEDVRGTSRALGENETFVVSRNVDFLTFTSVGAGGGRRLHVDAGGKLVGRRTVLQEAQCFLFESCGGGKLTIRSDKGTLVSVEPSGNVTTLANIPFATEQEQFTLILVGGSSAFYGTDGPSPLDRPGSQGRGQGQRGGDDFSKEVADTARVALDHAKEGLSSVANEALSFARKIKFGKGR